MRSGETPSKQPIQRAVKYWVWPSYLTCIYISIEYIDKLKIKKNQHIVVKKVNVKCVFLPQCNLKYDVLGSRRTFRQRVDIDRTQASSLRTEHNWYDFYGVEPMRKGWTSESHHCHDYLRLPSTKIEYKSHTKHHTIRTNTNTNLKSINAW